jgi:pimeloyl-ACP methyl ester carboxylesterase
VTERARGAGAQALRPRATAAPGSYAQVAEARSLSSSDRRGRDPARDFAPFAFCWNSAANAKPVSSRCDRLGEWQPRAAGWSTVPFAHMSGLHAAGMHKNRPSENLCRKALRRFIDSGRPKEITGLNLFSIPNVEAYDDELIRFEASGAPPLPVTGDSRCVDNNGARIWYSAYGAGAPVILLHGGLGHSGNWGYQVPALIDNGYRAVVIDSRGHGRSTRDEQPYSYELMASDVLAVMNDLRLDQTVLVGWSDGACTALILAANDSARVAGVFFFACNMDPAGLRPFASTPALNRCFARHTADYNRLSSTPERFGQFVQDVGLMQRTQPAYSAEDLAKIHVPVKIVQSERDEFIRREHAEYLTQVIPDASFLLLDGVSHFAPLQRPELFNTAMLAFVHEVYSGNPVRSITI